ncbi:DoxX family protein [Xanthobacter autotrophicus DSM 431]|uniref:DoxX family protein n=1 Tax=Xanthobacter nonsaccharivorans TaxID=3119912 RepID=UPI003728B939
MRILDDLALLLGRLCMAALFLPVGIGKIGNIAGFSAMLAAKGVPMPELMTYLTILVEVGGGVLLVLGLLPRIVAVILIGFTAIATATSHVFWGIPDAGAAAAQQIHFFKNVGLIGGLLFYFAAGAGRFAVPFGRKAG